MHNVVVATAKVQIFKQITTYICETEQRVGCCCYRKGTNFQANHNLSALRFSQANVVVATAKVQIFKQITTPPDSFVSQTELLLLPQRYKFSSKSQLIRLSISILLCCCCYRKGTNFQANHNCKMHNATRLYVVVATAKVQIFKQITTVCDVAKCRSTLLLLPQRYKFSSKSQQWQTHR